MKYAVEFLELSGWSSDWNENGEPLLFDTLKEANEEIEEHLDFCFEAYKEGYINDMPTRADFRIVEVQL